MKKYLPHFLSVVIFILAFLLRVQEYKNRAGFDWDQNRDYSKVVEIVEGKYVPLGPVAKGNGGFYLGSLYYYLLVPAFTLMKGDLGALPITSIFLDSLSAAAIFYLFRSSWGNKKSLLLALFWTFSWVAIDSSRTSWNVALIPIWSVLTLYSFTQLLQTDKNKKEKYFIYLALLFGLSFHIHVSAIPIIPMLFVFNFRSFQFKLSTWLKAAFVAALPLTPLILYDLTHDLENLHLVRTLIAYQNSFKIPFIDMLSMATLKFGKVYAGFITSKAIDNIVLGTVLLFISLIYAIKSKNTLPRLAGLTIISTFILVVALHDYGFPEYYFSISFIPMLFLIINLLKKLGKPILIILFAISLYLNINAYSLTPSSYNLKDKELMVEFLKEYNTPLDLRYNLYPGRDGGLNYLVDRAGIKRDSSSPTQVLVTDDLVSPLYIDGELCVDRVVIGQLRIAEHIVQ